MKLRDRFRGRFWFIREPLGAVGGIQEDDCVDVAAQTSFYFILVIFPFFTTYATTYGTH